MKISASEFKARCLAILDEVARSGEKVVITKRGRPVAELVPPTMAEGEFPQDALVGTVEVLGDVIAPAVEPGEWEAESAAGV
jgi:prevent-host-death family protein